MSKYTAQQIYALGQFIIANQSQFPNLRIGNQIRHLEFNAQRNLSDASEDYFVKYLHTTVDKVMEEAAAFQQRIMQPKKETHAPPTSAPPEPPKRRVAIFVPCFSCGKDVAVPEEKVDERVWCSNACYQGSLNLQNNAVNELTKFMNTVGEKYYDIQYNTDLMTGWLRDHNRTMTEDALLDAFFSLDKQGKLLKRLSAKEINSLTSEQYAQRLHIDPEMTNDSTTLSAVRKYQQKSGGVN